MHHWSFYFLAKLGLFYAGRMNFHWPANLLLALGLLWPLAPGRVRTVRAWVAWPLALGLLYYDSYLPAMGRVLSQVTALAQFRLDYLAELLQRAVEVRTLVAALALVAVYLLLARRIRFATVVFLGIFSVPVAALWSAAPAPATIALVQADGQTLVQTPDAQLQAFYASQAQRQLTPAPQAAPPFDIVVLQVCSLSWDDMEFVGLRDHPLLQRFDVVFTQFNSAASYSGPAALRLTRGACGQTSHHDLYEGGDAACYLFPSLEALGYTAQGLLNHDGVFDDFAKTLQARGGLAGRLQNPQGVPIAMRNFDGSPIYADGALLSRWWQQRQTQGPQPVALYYNTVSLHDGNRIEGVASRSSLDTYKPRLSKLLADFDQFLTELERTGRPVAVLLMPEHGAALRGDKYQISGMREIPNPRITLVPAALKLIGLPTANAPKASDASDGQASTPLTVEAPVSYYDVNRLVFDLIERSPFAADATPWAERLQTLTTTAFVAENDDVVMMRAPDAGGYLMRSGKSSAWVNYAP